MGWSVIERKGSSLILLQPGHTLYAAKLGWNIYIKKPDRHADLVRGRWYFDTTRRVVYLREWFVNTLRAFTSFDGRVLDRGPRVLRCDGTFAFSATVAATTTTTGFSQDETKRRQKNNGETVTGKLARSSKRPDTRHTRIYVPTVQRWTDRGTAGRQRWTGIRERPKTEEIPRCARRPGGETRLFDRAPRALHWQYKTPRLGIPPPPPSSATDSAYSRRRHARAAAVTTATTEIITYLLKLFFFLLLLLIIIFIYDRRVRVDVPQ